MGRKLDMEFQAMGKRDEAKRKYPNAIECVAALREHLAGTQAGDECYMAPPIDAATAGTNRFLLEWHKQTFIVTVEVEHPTEDVYAVLE